MAIRLFATERAMAVPAPLIGKVTFRFADCEA
jgi:hypothetical protein